MNWDSMWARKTTTGVMSSSGEPNRPGALAGGGMSLLQRAICQQQAHVLDSNFVCTALEEIRRAFSVLVANGSLSITVAYFYKF